MTKRKQRGFDRYVKESLERFSSTSREEFIAAQEEIAKIDKVVRQYSYHVLWSDQDQAYVGLCSEFPALSSQANAQIDAFEGILDLVADVVRGLLVKGEPLPKAKLTGCTLTVDAFAALLHKLPEPPK